MAIVVGTSVVPAEAAGYPNPGPRDVPDQAFAAGAYIIDAGAVTGAATKQTIAQGLKPYGLIYALVRARIPVQWIVNPSKPSGTGAPGTAEVDQALGNVGTDFSFDCDAGGPLPTKAYKTGAYVIPKEFAAQAAPLVSTWRAKGVVVDGPCAAPTPTLPVFATLTGWSRTALDSQNGSIAVDFYTNAEIPQGSLTDPNNPPAYRFASANGLTPCDDFYVMPHADPTYATHQGLIPFVQQGGYIWAGCHAVSVLEGVTYPVGHPQAGQPAMNFLTDKGLLSYKSHGGGSVPYAFYKQPGDTRPYYPSPYELDPVRSGALRLGDLLTQPRKVGG